MDQQPFDVEELVETLMPSMTKALQGEFSFIGGAKVSGTQETWEKAARGVLRRMGQQNRCMEVSFTAPDGKRYRARVLGILEEAHDADPSLS